MNATETDRYDALAARCSAFETELRNTQDRVTRLDAAALAQAEATARLLQADTQQTAETAEVRATTAHLLGMLVGPPSFDTRIAELHALVVKPATSTMSGPGFNLNLPDAKSLGDYGDALKKWGVRALAVAATLVALLKVNSCDTERTLDRIERWAAEDSTGRAAAVQHGDARSARNVDRIIDAIESDGAEPDSVRLTLPER